MSSLHFSRRKIKVNILNRAVPVSVFTFFMFLLVPNPSSSVEIILSYSSSPKQTTLNLTQCLNPEEGMALKLEIEDPVEDGGDEAEDTMGDFTEEEKGNMVFTILLNPGAIYTQKINISGQTTQKIPLCFDPKPKDLANVKSAKISATSDLVNDKNIKMTLVNYQCEEDPLIIENKKLRQQLLATKEEYRPISYLYIVGAGSVVVLSILLISLLCNCWQCRKSRHLKKNQSDRTVINSKQKQRKIESNLNDNNECTSMNKDESDDNIEISVINTDESDHKTRKEHINASFKSGDIYQPDTERFLISSAATHQNKKYVLHKSTLEKDPLIVEANSIHSKSMQKGINKIGDQVQENVQALLNVPDQNQVYTRSPSLIHLKDNEAKLDFMKSTQG